MADTNFIAYSNATKVTADWLNDVNKLRYGNDDATRGSALLQFIGAGSGAVTTTTQTALRATLNAAWYGFSPSASAATNDAAIVAAMVAGAAQGRVVIVSEAGTYSLSNTLSFTSNVHLHSGVVLSSANATVGFKFSGVTDVRVTGNGQLYCSGTNAVTLYFEPTASAHCQHNYLEADRIVGAGRGATPGSRSNILIEFERINGSFIAYYNFVRVNRLADADNHVLFDAPNASPASGANGNAVEVFHIDSYWYGAKFRSAGNIMKIFGAFGSGDASNASYLFYCENSTTYNTGICLMGEPGTNSGPYYIAAGSTRNDFSQMQIANFSAAGVNLGDANKEPDSGLYTGLFSSGSPSLLENTNYRIGKLTMGNTNSFVTDLRWKSLNSVTGEYSSGRATILGWAQGNVTVERITSEYAESDSTYASQSRFIGIQTDGFDVYFVFSVRNRGGSNATTQIVVEVDSIGPVEFKQTGPTITAAAITHPAFETYKNNSSVSSSGTGEDDLMSTSLPAGLLKRTGSVRITVAGTKTTGGGNKTVKLHFGTVAMTLNAAANDTNNWFGQVVVTNVASASVQRMMGMGLNGATPVTLYTTGTENTANAVTIKCTGECANAGDTITQTMMMIEYLP